MRHTFCWDNPKHRLFGIIVFVSVSASLLGVQFIMVPHQKKQRAIAVKDRIRKDKADAIDEYEHRQALKAETAAAETDADLGTDANLKKDKAFKSETETVGETDTERYEYYYEAPQDYWLFVYKWTPEQIQASNAPEDVKDWCIQRQVLHKREMAYYEKSSANTKAMIASGKEEKALLLKSWALLSPEQLAFAREEALKTHSVEKVDNFFNALAQSTNITPEEVHWEREIFLNRREALKIVERELAVEWIGILRARTALVQTKPF